MEIAVFGLGYVGLVSSVCLADKGFKVTGIEAVASKVQSLQEKKLYLYEPGLQERFARVIGSSFFPVLIDEVKQLPENILICVGTPPQVNGAPDLSYILATIKQISQLLQSKDGHYNIIIRSTIPPGSIEEKILPLLQPQFVGPRAVVDVHFYPEFLREGSAIHDFNHPSQNVWGSKNKMVPNIINHLCLGPPPEMVEWRSAEMIKYLYNSFHALKVAFANEFGTLCGVSGVNADEVFSVFLKETKLNISKAYLSPGFAFGGPCLTKELRALESFFSAAQVDSPLISSILSSNNSIKNRLVKKIEALGATSFGLLGVSFKPNTDDLRSSPLLDVVRYFCERPSYASRPVFSYLDPNVSADHMRELPVANAKTFTGLLEKSKIIVLGPKKIEMEEQRILAVSGKTIIDLRFFNYDFLREQNLPHYFDILKI